MIKRSAIALAIVCASARGHAEVTLEQAPGACSLDGVRSALDALLLDTDVDATVRIETRHDADGVHATLVLNDGAARELRASECDELAKSLALVIAMTLREPAIASPVVVETHSDTTPAPVALLVRSRDVPAVTPIDVMAIAGGLTNQRARPAIVLGGRVARGHASLGLELELARSETIDVGDDGTLRISRVLASVTACASVSHVALCGLATAGVIRGRGVSLANAKTVDRAAFETGLRVEWISPELDHLALRVHGDALQAIGSVGFLVDQMSVWRTEPRELRLGIDLVVMFL